MVIRHRAICILRFTVGLLAAAGGCLAPPAGRMIPTSRPGGDDRAGWETHPGAPPVARDWLPVIGRAVDDLRRRHGLDAPLETLVLDETFDQTTSSLVPGWEINGFPSLRPLALDGATGLELRAPADVTAACGLEHRLNARMLAGRDVRVDVRLTCRSFIRVEAMKNVRVVLTGKDQTGRSCEVALPLEIGVSPGWEWQHFWLRCKPDLSDARLGIIAAGPGAAVTLDAIRIAAALPFGKATPSSAGGTRNLILDGDFETGESRFFASGEVRWPNGDERTVPLGWQIGGNPALGGNTLNLSLNQAIGRVGFGPLDLSEVEPGSRKRLFLSFMAQASRPTTVVASLRTRTRDLGRVTYPLTQAWDRFAGAFEIQADSFDQRIELADSELVFEFAGDDSPEPNLCGLDAVVLQDSPVMSRYVPASAMEIGLAGPAHDSTDVRNLFDAREQIAFSLRIAGGTTPDLAARSNSPPTRNPRAQLALDVVDAWDRVVTTRTRTISIPTGEPHAERIDLGALPRGYYRILATLWEGSPGQSALIAQTSMPLAAISLRDPVPTMGYFGLSSWSGNISMRTTQLGSAWVRMDVPSSRCRSPNGEWDLSTWEALLGECQRAQVDIVADVDLPATAEGRRSFIEEWLLNSTFPPAGIIVRPPAIGLRSGRDYLLHLDEVRKLVGIRWPSLHVVEDLSFLDGLPNGTAPTDGGGAPIVWGLGGRDSKLPEAREGYLEAIGRRRPSGTEVWELGAAVHLGGAPRLGLRRPLRQADLRTTDPVVLLEPPVDPVRSASRLVRSMLIRTLAGASMVCSEATALAPPRSIQDDDRTWLHERDLTPRPAIVTLDLAAELLNNATPIRWIDLPGGARVLYFEKDDGGAVAAFWRPYGLAATRVGFTRLPASTVAMDCLGLPAALLPEGNRQILDVNEIVRYLTVPADQRETFRQILDELAIELRSPSPVGKIPASAPASQTIR